MNLLTTLRTDRAENSIMQTITIAVSAILIAAGLVTAPGLINNARDNNARTDLANIAFAQEFALGSSGEYFNLDAVGAPAGVDLEGIKYSLSGNTAGHRALVCSDPAAYLIRATSDSGTTFYRASGSGETVTDVNSLDLPTCITDQLALSPDFVVAGGGGNGGGNGGGTGNGINCVAPAPGAVTFSGGNIATFTPTAIAVCDSTGTLFAQTRGVGDDPVFGGFGWDISTITGDSSFNMTPNTSAAQFRVTIIPGGNTVDGASLDRLYVSDGMGGQQEITDCDIPFGNVVAAGDSLTYTCDFDLVGMGGGNVVGEIRNVYDDGSDFTITSDLANVAVYVVP